MKRVEKIVICLASGLALTAGVRADVATLPGDPYATVVTRNIFGLNPPPPAAPPVDATPPPKITPNGIMTIFGQVQVLFKVAVTPRPGVPAPPTGDPSYILSEGQRQDDIEVIKIDERNSIVTFNNHGETQQLPLVVTAPSSTPAPTPSIAAAGGGDPNGNNFGNSGNGVGGIAGNGVGGNGSANSGNPNNGSNLGNGQPRNAVANAADQIPKGMTEEVQTIAIEANRLQAKQQGEPDIFPTTPLTEQPDSGSGPTSPQ